VSLTDEGAGLLDRARRILADLREAEQVAAGSRSAPRGLLYVTAPVMFGRLHVLPEITLLMERHAQLTAQLLLTDRNVRIVEEGIDVAVRIGALADSALRGVTIGSVCQTIVASPAYLDAHGTPVAPAQLARHRCIVGAGQRIGGAWPVGPGAGSAVEVTPRFAVNTVDAAIAAAEAGVGLANLLSYQVADAIAAGRLVPVLGAYQPPPLPVSLLFDGGRAAVPSVRLFVEAMRARAAGGAWS
jgi:DNA-binding transcriptional LysR family regulator